MAKCQRTGCPNLRKGQSATASVFDERKKAKSPQYAGHKEQWCVECYQELEAHKYTYVINMPTSARRKLTAKRIARKQEVGEVIVEAQVKLATSAPIESGRLPNETKATPPELLPAVPPEKRKPGRPPISKLPEAA